jgi:DNA-directed RNA polymerase specialized sigma24 family protein
LSYAEIAEAMGISIKGVESSLPGAAVTQNRLKLNAAFSRGDMPR